MTKARKSTARASRPRDPESERSDEALLGLARTIATRSPERAPALAAAAKLAFAIDPKRAGPLAFWLEEITHYVYGGDTLLHVAAAAYDLDAAKALVAAGADVRAKNRRGAEPLHYAADGIPGSKTWDPDAQRAMVAFLLEHGADANAFDHDGVGPLHRAVRTRSTGAVEALLEGGADRTLRSGRGSTAKDLANQTTGRGGSGSPDARRERAAILRLLE
jgi:hypothetical protein